MGETIGDSARLANTHIKGVNPADCDAIEAGEAAGCGFNHPVGDPTRTRSAITVIHLVTTANRLVSATRTGQAYTFAYNGLGDRLRQTVNGTPTTRLDLEAGLTQVLSDGTNT